MTRQEFIDAAAVQIMARRQGNFREMLGSNAEALADLAAASAYEDAEALWKERERRRGLAGSGFKWEGKDFELSLQARPGDELPEGVRAAFLEILNTPLPPGISASERLSKVNGILELFGARTGDTGDD